MKAKLAALPLLLSAHVVSATEAPTNIIYMIGDGMGSAYTSAYRYYKDDLTTKAVDPTIFDELFVGMAYTYPEDKTYVTDSAASATALSSGKKSFNGAIAVDLKLQPVKTMLEIAKEKGMTTGLVATSQINHATPASFVAHNISRRNYNKIADDYVDNKINGALPVDLLLGGGTKYFVREDRNLVEEFKQANYQYVDQFEQLNSLTKLPAMALLAPKGLPFALDENPTRLEKLTQKTLSLLDKHDDKDGFFVMIEGSQIDWCGHANDIACAMSEMDDFAKSIELAKAYVDQNPDTLLVITADHSTGGLTLGNQGHYKWEPKFIHQVSATSYKMANSLIESKDLANDWLTFVEWPLDEEQTTILLAAQKEGERQLSKAIRKVISDKSYTGWTTKGHTAEDVQVFAYGKGSDVFRGAQNNTEIADKLIEFIK